MSDYETLKAEAEELGIEVDGRWKEGRLQEEIDKVLASDESDDQDADDTDTDTDTDTGEGDQGNPDDHSSDEEDQEDEESLESETYQNVSRCAQSLFGTRVMPGKEYTLAEQDKADKKGMARLDRAVNVFGYFKEV